MQGIATENVKIKASKQRFSIIPGDFVEDDRPQLIHYRVLTFMGRHTDRHGWCAFSQSKMAKRFSVVRETVNRAIRDLVEWGYVEKIGQKETGKLICQYRVLMDRHSPPPFDPEEDEETCEPEITGGCDPEINTCDSQEVTQGVTRVSHTITTPFLSTKKDPHTPQGGPSPSDALKAFELWNETALRCALPQAAKLTKDRQRKIIARLKEYGLEGWQQALANIERSSFLTGKNDRNWRATLEFLLQASSFSKVHDGAFGNGRHAEPKTKITYLDEPWIREARAAMDY